MKQYWQTLKQNKTSFIWLLTVLVAPCRLSCPEARGILVPQLGFESASPALQGALNHWTAGEVPGKHSYKCLKEYWIVLLFKNGNIGTTSGIK